MRIFKKAAKRYRYSTILLKEIVKTDFILRYQGSALGYLWALLRPLFLFIVIYTVFVYLLKIGKGVEHWPVALLLGIVIWSFFSEITNHGLKSVVGHSSIVRKINFPKYVIIFATGISALINLIINLVIIAIFIAINGVDITWSILLLPLFILEIFIFGLGLAFFLSTVYVKFRDMNFIWDVIMQALFYGSVIIYPINRLLGHNFVTDILMLNPIAQTVQNARHVVIGGSDMPSPYQIVGGNMWLTLAPYIIVIIIFIVGAFYFKRKSPTFAEES